MRAFIIGNGPSLKDTNLDLIEGETSFAVNRIHLIYPHTSWRPTHYVRAEEQSLKSAAKYHDEVRLHINMGCEVWTNDWYTVGTDMKGKTNTIVSCWHYTHHFDHPEVPHLWHFPKLCTFGSSINVAIQLAVQKGFKPIYLLGCDLGYVDGGKNHFDPDYTRDIENELRPARYANIDTLTAHMICARSSPVKIYNCTPVGLLRDLGVYENVRLEDIV